MKGAAPIGVYYCGANRVDIGRRSKSTRGEGPTGQLPGLAAAEKKQAAIHDGFSLSDRGHGQ